jgi:hypothetical protein
MTLLVAAGAVVFWPAVRTPFFLDDYLHSAMVHGRFPAVRGPFALYDFVGDDDRAALFSRGFLPWWTDTHITLRFLRPLSSALLYYEHEWLEPWPLVMHLHSFAWWIAAVFAARAFFKSVITPKAAAFATVIFALAPCHALPIGWLANREALLALAFGTVGLSAFLRWQKGAGHAWALLSLGAFSLALAAGEYALGCAGYVLAFAWRAPKEVPRRWRSVLLFVLPAVAYLVARRMLGYGAEASGFYQDPLRDTWLFLRDAPWRMTVLVLAGWFSQDSTAWRWGPAEWPVALVVLVLAVAGCAALRHVTSQQEEGARRSTWTLLWGSLFALVPVLAVLPSARLLGVAMLGIAPVVGVVLETAWFTTQKEARHGLAEWTAIAATLLGFAHLVHGPGRAWANARQIRGYAVGFAEHTADLAKRLEGQAVPDVVVVRGLDDVFFYGFALEGLGVRNTHWTVLSHTGHVLCLRRDATTMDLVVGPDAGLYPASLGDLYRSEAHPLAAEETFLVGDVNATVEEMSAYGPRRVRFQFTDDLDDPRWTWVGESRSRGFYDATPPKIGFGVPFEP